MMHRVSFCTGARFPRVLRGDGDETTVVAPVMHRRKADAMSYLLAWTLSSQEYLDTNTARCVNAIGEESLQHIIGGEANLWARPLLTSAGAFESVKKVKRQAVEQSAGNMSDPAADAARSEETLLLAARLQGTVSMGLGPTIARALTAIIPDRGGEWMLPTAEPVQVR